MYTIQEIIEIAKISQYLSANDIAQKGLFGGGVDNELPNKLYNIRKSVEWAHTYSQNITEVNAIGTINIINTGNIGQTLQVFVDDPVLGYIFLGQYQIQPGNSSPTAVAILVANALNTNTYGYVASSTGSIVSITARPGLGNSINGGLHLFVNITQYLGTFDNTFDYTFN
jgi:hypothetical protein